MKSLNIPLVEKLNHFLPRGEVCLVDQRNKQIIINNIDTNTQTVINLVGAHGFAGAGKDTLCDSVSVMLEKHNNTNNLKSEDDASPWFMYKKFAFAYSLKKACSNIFGIDFDMFTEQKLKEKEHVYWEMSPRRIAQLVGTEAMREGFDRNIWINSVEWQIINELTEHEFGTLRERIDEAHKINKKKEIHVFLFVSDVRFENEAEWIRNSGGRMFFISRPVDGLTKVPKHDSENGVRLREDLKDVNIENNDSLYNYMKNIERTFRTLYFSR